MRRMSFLEYPNSLLYCEPAPASTQAACRKLHTMIDVLSERAPQTAAPGLDLLGHISCAVLGFVGLQCG